MEPEKDSEEELKDETPRQRFVRLASLRTNEILKRLKILGNCSNRRLYEYDAKDIYKIFDEIEKKVGEIKTRFLDAKEREFRV